MPIHSPLQPAEPLQLPVRYLAPASYYALMAGCDEAEICCGARFDKRDKATHRTTIADANGVINLTVPIEKPRRMTGLILDDIIISDHDSWWNIHFTALKSAYGRTPFFEFYEYDFAPFYTRDWAGRRLTDYTCGLDALVRRLLHIDAHVVRSDRQGVRQTADCGVVADVPYYQVRADKFGFVGGLSVVDLLFNMGPEAELVLGRMHQSEHAQAL